MDKLSEELSGEKIGSVFIYTHEAHPGEYVPHLRSFEQKLEHGRLFAEHCRVSRPVLADSLDGRCHRYFGSMPNMTWIISRAGIAVYKSDWTEAGSVKDAITGLLSLRKQRRERRSILSPFRVERLEYREKDREAFVAWLRKAGPKAVREYTALF